MLFTVFTECTFAEPADVVKSITASLTYDLNLPWIRNCLTKISKNGTKVSKKHEKVTKSGLKRDRFPHWKPQKA